MRMTTMRLVWVLNTHQVTDTSCELAAMNHTSSSPAIRVAITLGRSLFCLRPCGACRSP